MGYFIDPEGNYPRHAGDIQAVDPDFIEGESALPEGWVEVGAGVIPTLNEGEIFVEIAPKKINGKWIRQFEVVPEPVRPDPLP